MDDNHESYDNNQSINEQNDRRKGSNRKQQHTPNAPRETSVYMMRPTVVSVLSGRQSGAVHI
jgi:hypothetical protein